MRGGSEDEGDAGAIYRAVHDSAEGVAEGEWSGHLLWCARCVSVVEAWRRAAAAKTWFVEDAAVRSFAEWLVGVGGGMRRGVDVELWLRAWRAATGREQ